MKMNGVIGCDDPATNHYLLDDLKEPEYLIALLQRYFQEKHGYNLDGQWDYVTPREYREVMNEELRKIEDAIWNAFINAEKRITDLRDGKNK